MAISGNQIVYVVIITVTLIVLLLFARGMIVRRARPSDPHSSHSPVDVIVIGGGWRDGGIGGIGGPRMAAYRVPTDLPRVVVRDRNGGQVLVDREGHVRVNRRHDGMDEETVDELPRYEAPPPGYESVVKDDERAEAQGRGNGGPAVEMERLSAPDVRVERVSEGNVQSRTQENEAGALTGRDLEAGRPVDNATVSAAEGSGGIWGRLRGWR